MEIFFHFIVAFAVYLYIMACPAKRWLSREEILERLDAARFRNPSGSVHLGNLTNPSWHPYALRNVILIKAAERAPVTFHCHDTRSTRPDGNSHAAIGWNDMEFTRPDSGPEKSRSATACGCTNATGSLVGFKVHPHNSTFLTVTLKDFSHSSTGRYECRWYSGAEVFVSQRYVVSAVFTAQQLFTPPMKNVTAKIGERVEMRCCVRFDSMFGGLEPRFMWTNDHDILLANYADHLRHVVRRRKGMIWWQKAIEGKCYMALIIESVKREDAGRYSCWFRADDVLEEWLVQNAFLTVTD